MDVRRKRKPAKGKGSTVEYKGKGEGRGSCAGYGDSQDDVEKLDGDRKSVV